MVKEASFSLRFHHALSFGSEHRNRHSNGTAIIKGEIEALKGREKTAHRLSLFSFPVFSGYIVNVEGKRDERGLFFKNVTFNWFFVKGSWRNIAQKHRFQETSGCRPCRVVAFF